ncbi:MAG: hypothetical protein ATN36_04040 [Epulopiscium sp. Nele67-Bin005]|nr:MAG: hypothetical protein ATN36_04040 [Epulopiscium sp. Nele67-Bin005]
MNIVVYKASGGFNYDVVNIFSDELAQGFKNLGHNVELIDVNTEKKFPVENIDMIVTFNAIFGMIPQVANFYSQTNILMVTLLVDSPLYLYERIKKLSPQNTIIGMYASHFLGLYDKYFSENNIMVQVMHGGTQVEHLQKCSDIVMAGSFNIPNKELIDTIKNNISYLHIKKIYKEQFLSIIDPILKEAMEDRNSVLEWLFDKHLEIINFNGYPKNVMDNFRIILAQLYEYIDKIRRYDMRFIALKTLLEAGLTVDLYGDCQLQELRKYPNLNIYGPRPYLELLKKVAASKIWIHDIAPNVNGSHERVFSGMLNKTLVICNQNDYVNGEVKDGETIVFYDANKPEQLAEKVKYYLEHDDEREKIVKQAYNYAKDKHTWQNRAVELTNLYYIYQDMKQNK